MESSWLFSICWNWTVTVTSPIYWSTQHYWQLLCIWCI